MCIAIVKPPKVTIPNSILGYCHENNKDGCGMSYVDNSGELIIYKTMDFTEFMATYKEAFRNNPNSTFLLHFRVATHGTVNEFNCHPFRVNENQVMMHNGTIHKSAPIKSDKNETRSDTQIFNDTILSDMPIGWEKSVGIAELIEDYIGSSKIVTMDSDGEVNMFNDHLGNWHAGCWWSNYSYYKGVRSLVKNKPNHEIHAGPFVYTPATNSTKKKKHIGGTGDTNKGGDWRTYQMDRSLDDIMSIGGRVFKFHNNQKYILQRNTTDNYLWKACNIQGDILTGGAIYTAIANDEDVANVLAKKNNVVHGSKIISKGGSDIRRKYFPCSLCEKTSVPESDLNVIEMRDITRNEPCYDLLCDECLRDLQNISSMGWKVVVGVDDMNEFYTERKMGSPI